MVVVVPTALERELATALSAVLDGPAEDNAMILAQALASHRERCTALASAIVTGVEVDARFTVAELDAALDDIEWITPDAQKQARLRELVEAHRNLLSMLMSARELVRKIGASRPATKLER